MKLASSIVVAFLASLLLAAGAWTRDLAAAMGVEVPVAPQRGQILHFALPGVETSAWPVIRSISARACWSG